MVGQIYLGQHAHFMSSQHYHALVPTLNPSLYIITTHHYHTQQVHNVHPALPSGGGGGDGAHVAGTADIGRGWTRIDPAAQYRQLCL